MELTLEATPMIQMETAKRIVMKSKEESTHSREPGKKSIRMPLSVTIIRFSKLITSGMK